MSYFPFDTQVCYLKFGSWSYWKSLLNLMHTYPTNELIGDVSIWTFDQSERSGRKPVLKSLFQGQTGEIVVDEKAYIKSTEWEIISKEGKIHEIKYDCCPATYQATYSINFDFTCSGSSTNSWQSVGLIVCLF